MLMSIKNINNAGKRICCKDCTGYGLVGRQSKRTKRAVKRSEKQAWRNAVRGEYGVA